MSVYSDSPTGQQFHVRFHVRGEGPLWSYVYDDEADARQVLAAFEADPHRTDVGLWVRDVTPWRQA